MLYTRGFPGRRDAPDGYRQNDPNPQAGIRVTDWKQMTTSEKEPYFVSIGKEAGNIDVRLSYRIIELFSEGLYASANKAVEELVANSFDAGAQTVQVVVWFTGHKTVSGSQRGIGIKHIDVT